MKNDKSTPVTPIVKVEAPVGPTPCAVCGQYTGEFVPVGNARVHEACATAHPDVIAKVKARA